MLINVLILIWRYMKNLNHHKNYNKNQNSPHSHKHNNLTNLKSNRI